MKTSNQGAIKPLTLAVSLALLQMGTAFAQSNPPATPAEPPKQEAPEAAKQEPATPTDAAPASAPGATPAPPAPATSGGDALNLDKVIVTGTSQRATRMRSSVSTTVLGGEQVQQTQASSAAEVLRSIPGVRSESSAGESNANMTVRGLPISAGGSRYALIQEDGLPLLQTGDFNFITPDAYMRIDNAFDRLEVVRGGSAATLATNSPGGIYNFISKTGTEEGAVASLSRGIDYDSTRAEFGWGGSVGPKMRAYIGGFYRLGEGPRNGGVNVENGGQIRANITKEFDGGYLRFSVKHLDDHTPTFLPVPVRIQDGKISEYDGIDPRKASFYSPYWTPDITLTASNGRASSNVNNGFGVKTNAFGAEGEFDLGSGWKVQNKFRHAKNSGQFLGVFPGSNPAAAPAGTTYLTGPRAGQAYSGQAFTAVVFNTTLDDMSLTANDLRLAKSFDFGSGGNLTGTLGTYYSLQKVAMTWNFNQYLMELSGDKPALLTAPGFTNGDAAFRDPTNANNPCCMRNIDADYKTTAIYGVLAYQWGALNVDASVRYHQQDVAGRWMIATGPGTTYPSYNLLSPNIMNYSVDDTPFSLGANYSLTRDLAVFTRYSEGASFPGDRSAFGNATVDGTAEVQLNKVKQLEFGSKWRSGPFSLFATAFWAKTEESNYILTLNLLTQNSFDAKGLELEGGFRMGGFAVNAGATYTDAEVTASNNPALVGTTPYRQAKLVFQVAPRYTIGPVSFGASAVGSTKSKDRGPVNGNGGVPETELPAYVVVNGFFNWEFARNASVALGANNIFNTLAYTESQTGPNSARALNGRTVKATLQFLF